MLPLRIGRRTSDLAKAQASLVIQAALGMSPCVFHEVDIMTTGDRITDRPLYDIGGKALFCKEIDAALREGVIDWAVHSLKDVESDLPDDLHLAAVLPAGPPHDVVVVSNDAIQTLDDVPHGAKIGTSSLRRAGHLRAVRPDLDIQSLRGNVPTRLLALKQGFDGVVLAAAGLERLNLPHARMALPVSIMTPAVAQGVIGVVILKKNKDLWQQIFSNLDHAPTRNRIMCERALLSALNATCKTPIGVYAEYGPDPTTLTLHVSLVHPDESLRWYRSYPVTHIAHDIPTIAGDIRRNAPDAVMGWG